MDAEQFSLKWNNFHSNLTSGFHALLQGEDLVDVTFAVEGKFLQAHKLVLSVCSPYFKQMFKIHPDKHPIIILKGVAYNDLSDILLFMYQGEVNVRQENLANFLKTAELLQIKGLTEDDSSNDGIKPEVQTEKETPADSLLSQFRYQAEQAISNMSNEHTPVPSNRSPTPSQTSTNNSSYKRSTISPQQNTEMKKARTTKVEDSVPDSMDIMNATPKSEPCYMDDDYESSSGMADFTQLMESSQKDLNVPPSLMPPLASSILQDSSQQDHAGDDKTRTTSNNRSNSKPTKKSSNSFECGECLKIFTRRDHLRTHERNIHGERTGPLVCQTCCKLYKNAESMRKHMAKYHQKDHQNRSWSVSDQNRTDLGGEQDLVVPPLCVIDDDADI